jgi:hypothetical protein
MIHNLYIIKPNGICIFHEKYGSLEEDPQSVAGFLTAISMFSKAIIGEKINTLATKSFKFVFKTDGKFTFVTFNDIADKPDETFQLLDNVKKLFYNKFPKAENVCESGSLKPFEKLKCDLEDIINKN